MTASVKPANSRGAEPFEFKSAGVNIIADEEFSAAGSAFDAAPIPPTIQTREAATALSVAPSTAHHILTALVTEGVLQQDARSGRYTLGLELFQFAHHAINQLPFHRASMPQNRSRTP